ncbi:MAG TPA: hypothetical protein VGX48_25205 [Pyrinomonadaceae bacterium]|jgi:hypothetical protein|nr:hypothetical protein [Pyrinomonadaceae bacterium]
MTTSTREITTASLSVSQDPGHGGAHSHYRIDRLPEGYEVSVTIGRRFPAPGERSFQPSTMTQVLHKDGREAADFLSGLALVHRVFEVEGRACPHAFLHPTFYSFGFTDSEGVSHAFEYSIEAGNHHDDTCRELVEEFERFFEARRIERSLYEGEIKPPEPPGRRGRLRRKFSYLISLFFNR